MELESWGAVISATAEVVRRLKSLGRLTLTRLIDVEVDRRHGSRETHSDKVSLQRMKECDAKTAGRKVHQVKSGITRLGGNSCATTGKDALIRLFVRHEE